VNHISGCEALIRETCDTSSFLYFAHFAHEGFP